MPSAKSHFNFGLFVKDIKRFWPIWFGYLLIWVFALPAQIMVTRWSMYTGQLTHVDNLLSTLYGGGLALSFCFAPLVAMAVFSYLYKGKAANLMHALPIRREGLFLTHYLSGLTFLLVPNLLVFLLTLAAWAAQGLAYHPIAWVWLAVQCLICLFFYSFAVFCGMFTGLGAALPVFYAALNFVFPGLYYIISNMFTQFLYGFAGFNGGELVLLLSPAAAMQDHFYSGMLDGGIFFTGLPMALIYGAVGLVLAAAALAVYRKRHIERAGDLVTVAVMRPVFKYGVAFCSALVLGVALNDWLSNGYTGDAVRLTGCILFCGAVGYIAAEMLLKKSFRVLRSWRGGAIFLGAMFLCCLAVSLDLTGYERRVPDNVASVEVSSIPSLPYDSARYSGRTVTDPALIAAVRDLHTAIVREAISGALSFDPTAISHATDPHVQTYGYAALSLDYTLGSGASVRRRYHDLPISTDRLQDPDSSAAKLQALLNHPALRPYAPFDAPGLTPQSATLTFPTVGDITLSTREAGEVYAAMHEDFAAGRLGRRFLLEDADYLQTCYINSLVFNFPGTVQSDGPYGVPMPARTNAGLTGASHEVDITLQATATSTIAALVRLGILDSADDLMTMAQYNLYRY